MHGVIPVVGDGKWIWTKPPETERGYLEPRSFSLSIGIELDGKGESSDVIATTPVPVEHPEQKVEKVNIETEGCEASIRELAPGAGQLVLNAATVSSGQKVRAIAHYTLTLFKQYHAYERDQFPAAQNYPPDVKKGALKDSPGIQTSLPAVKKLADEIAEGKTHPWDKAKAFADWIPHNIRPQIGRYTSVEVAIKNRVGDCEEMSALFVAFCRSVGIPARLVWVPHHNWSEFYLTDDKGKGHWIPAHTACYHWFGWTGAHELVIQKGDRVKVPEQNRNFRLLEDWLHGTGGRPKAKFIAELAPVAGKGSEDPGPGARKKDPITGEWKLQGSYVINRDIRQ